MRFLNPTFCGEPIDEKLLYGIDGNEGFDDGEALIPVGLLRKFCELKGLPYPLDSQEEREQRMRRAAVSEGAGQQAASTGEVIAGLTVAEVRQVFERHQPVADIVKALAWFDAIPEGGVQEKSETTLRSRLGSLAHDHDWAAGTGKGKDAIPNSQWQGWKPVLMPGKPGRKPKKEITQHN